MARIPESETHIMQLNEWGWDVELKKGPNGTYLSVQTPAGKGYYFEIDQAGNVSEYITGNYVRVVMGNVIEQTHGSRVDDSFGPAIAKSASYVALSAPKVHLNPAELKGPLQDMIPAILKEI